MGTYGVCSPILDSRQAVSQFVLGAQVLAASLRDGGTTKKLAVIVPADEVHRLLPQTLSQLEVHILDSIVMELISLAII